MTEEGDGAPGEKPFSLFGVDVYLLGFIAVGGGFVLFAVFLLFFTRSPIPVYCGSGRHSTPVVCGWISRGSPGAR